ncbi:MAG TPA: single-stranded DNA-binding protein [Acidobacteriota bacterium]|nr:single-stranded DNA-binding protein [Acidobacteriota bacterium]
MSSLNKVILIGHLGKDPEIRYTPEGAQVATFSLATNESWADKSGTRQERTEWHNIVAWGRYADLSKKFLTKGRQVYIEGKLRTREWNDREGGKRRTTDVTVTGIVLLGSRSQYSDGGHPAEHPDSSSSPEADQAFGDPGITDNDIPF